MGVRRSTVTSTIALFGLLTARALLAAQNTGSEIITFDAPGADTTANDYNGTFPSGINDWGVIVGSYVDAKDVNYGFLRGPDGKYTTFQAPGADTTAGSYNGTVPKSINDLGTITGLYYDVSGVSHGFSRSPHGAFTTFDAPGAMGNGTFPMAINLEGAIVGYYLDSGFLFHAFLRRPDGSFATWVGPDSCDTNGSQGCYGSAAFSINIFGAIAGGYQDNSANQVTHGLRRGRDGKLTPFEAPGAGTGAGQGTGCPGCSPGINESGTIAGIYTDANNVFHGYLRSPEGWFTPIDAPGAGAGAGQGTGCSSDCPVGLNDSGMVAGTYIDANNVYHGFLRSPKGTLTTIDAPGAGTESYQGTTCPFCGLGINQWGAIAGSYLDANNVYHGFLRLPQRFH